MLTNFILIASYSDGDFGRDLGHLIAKLIFADNKEIIDFVTNENLGHLIANLIFAGLVVLFVIGPACLFARVQNSSDQLKTRRRKTEIKRNAGAALEELESGIVRQSEWAEALLLANGDERRAKIEYLKIRAKNGSEKSNLE